VGNRDAAAAFPAGGRFELVRELGRGGMGVVYEVVDRERRLHLALKGVRKVGPHAVLRLKNEFRAVRDIQHPNLVRLDEMFEQDGAWFFTMELIHGSTLMRWIRPDETEGALPTDTATPPTQADGVAARWSREVVTETFDGLVPARPVEPRRGTGGGSFDEARLRAALRGLVGGLVALHRAGIVHRDVKPSNVMVGDDGRIVLLDFGVVTDVASDETRREVVGTLTYMAPEQVTAGEVGPAADWYALGVVLFEAMTGDVPFAGKGALEAKCREEAPSPRTWSDALPEDLTRLCERLLRRDPSERPTGAELMTFCGLDRDSDDVGFVGRAAELARMRAAFDAGGPRAIFVTGESGIGKSSLAARFVEEVRAARPDVLVLRARCDQRELVSYNAFDGAVDGLARHLAAHPVSAPGGVAPLLRIFPVLRSVAALDEAARRTDPPPIVDDMRSLAFAALADLLAATAARRPVVLLVDDIHWADADSLALLGELFAGDAAPPVLLVATARLDADGTLPARAAVKVPTDVIALGGLAPAEAEALVRATAPDADAARLASETGGHPMFLAEIALRSGASGSHAPRLDDTLWQRITELDASCRAVLEVVALGGAPLPVGAVPAAAGLGPEGFARALGAVRGARLIRVTGTRDHDVVEPYHDRVRETVVAHLDVARRREIHRAIVTGLEANGALVEMLAYHLAEAGDGARAAALAEAAARRALDALAFDRAAEWLRLTLDLGELAPARRRALLIERADMLARAGRTLDAADTFLAAADGLSLEDSRELRRRAAEELLIGGHFLRGRVLARQLSDEIGVGVPQSTASAIAHLVWYGLRLRLSRLRWKTRTPDDDDRMRLDHAWSLCTGFSMVDSMRGAVLAMRAPLLALRAADPGRLGRGFCAGATAAAGMGSRRLAERLRSAAHRAADEDPAAALYAGFADVALAFYLDNDWPAALRACERSAALVPAGRGHTFEADVIEQHRVWSMSMVGDYRGLRRRVPQAIRSAQRIGNRFVEISFRTFFGNLHLIDDRPADATADVDDALAAWAVADDEVTNPLFFAMKSRSWTALYQRTADDRALDDGWRKIDRSLLAKIPMIRLETCNFHAQLAIARRQVDEARRWSKRARKIRLPHAPRLADMLDAGIAIAAGHHDDAARRLPAVIAHMESCHQRASAAAARWRLGEILGGDEGAAHLASAKAFFVDEGVVRPERWVETLLPVATASS
jgi:hypothetical protein